MKPDTPRARPLLQEMAYDRLKKFIQEGRYPPGTFLSERRLSKDLGMSKTPIRAALTRLDIEGFVSVSPQQGILVRETSLREIVDIFGIREALETHVAASIAGRLTPPQARRLRQNLDEQEESTRQGDIEALTRLDTEFHLMLCEFLDNREIVRVMLRLRDKLQPVILRVMKAPGRPADACREHQAVAEAILRGRGGLAAERMKKHLEFGRKYLVSG